MYSCPKCNGKGFNKVWLFHVKCKTCKGSGFSPVHYDFSKFDRDIAPLHTNYHHVLPNEMSVRTVGGVSYEHYESEEDSNLS